MTYTDNNIQTRKLTALYIILFAQKIDLIKQDINRIQSQEKWTHSDKKYAYVTALRGGGGGGVGGKLFKS